jgi:hypothetical protein
LPALGLPASATEMLSMCALQRDLNVRGFFAAQGQAIALDDIRDRVAKWRNALDKNWLAAQNAHFGKAPPQRAIAANFDDGGVLTGAELI